MIDARELKLGNYVLINDNVCCIDSINRKGVDIWASGTGEIEVDLFEKLQPIPLSPEILEKSGFVQQIDETIWFKNPFHLNLDSCFWWCIDGCFEGEEGSQWREISHLHQLQNLYYSLTGTELEINLQ